ncbi:hypothetical protein [Arthrobacter bambusae]|uniref:Lipase n=1 Tax=Arthrobacter bambusae TaxID=1338426 RepID=A0AAW8DAG7_9MICC|nr:hypothetical protein [Arthrobacter bambusae]MDP9903285.1 hypothetical protein [Arthrobacter bambusae]MDQ0128721.1 hypothetical protein [Arthrobacter bambusae]MDQ0180062.1 hypothetical protein [Arthrobacter bambusae]
MTSDKDYKEISQDTYFVDPLAHASFPVIESSDGKQKYAALKVPPPVSDPVTGFQAVAVAPLLPDGNPDMSHVIVSFAGTNPGDAADIVSDAQSVVAGKAGPGSQVAQAQAFAADVAAKVRADHPNASFAVTGHSLGGFLALDVAAENHWPATTFNGPDPSAVLSPQAKEWVQTQKASGQRPLTNYVDQYDLIGNVNGNGTGAAVYVKDQPGRLNPLDYHNLSAFSFATDGSGAVLGKGAEHMSTGEIAWNATSLIPDPVLRTEVSAQLAGLLIAEKVPAVARTTASFVTDLAVLVNTVGAADLAARIGALTHELSAIKTVNEGLVDAMTVALNTAKGSAFALYPFVSEADIENCIRQHGLEVHENIDESAVAAVSALVDDHMRTVTQISEGIAQMIANSELQDAQWSGVLSGR